MAFRKKSSDKTESNPADIETILRYSRKGITLSQEQESLLQEHGGRPLTVIERQKKAVSAAMGIINSAAGLEAIKERYYTEFFGYLYSAAIGQLSQNLPINIKLPDPIPADWKALGNYRKSSENKNQIISKTMTKTENLILDQEIIRQMEIRA